MRTSLTPVLFIHKVLVLEEISTKSTNSACLITRAAKDLKELSALGHFLKGSSATLGLTKVRDGCEKIQRYGQLENEEGVEGQDEGVCLTRIAEVFRQVKEDYKEVEKALRAFYGDRSDTPN